MKSRRDVPMVFISHGQQDSAIANVLREFVIGSTAGRVRVYQSASPEPDPRVGRQLQKELTATLRDADVVFCVYTGQGPEWTYCAWECGIAVDPIAGDTRVVIFQFVDDWPLPFTDMIRVEARDRRSVTTFVESFLTDPEFFPLLGQPILSGDQNDPRILRAADLLFDELATHLRTRGPAEKWSAWPFVRLRMDAELVDRWKPDLDLPVRLGMAKDALLTSTAVVDADTSAQVLLGLRTGAETQFHDVANSWKDTYGSASLGWVDSLAHQLMLASFRQFPDPHWVAMSDPFRGEGKWYMPILSRVHRVPRSQSVLFDVYFVALRRNPKTGQPEITFAADPSAGSSTPGRQEVEPVSAARQQERGGVFISYRREDAQGYVRALYDSLVSELVDVPVFRDVDALRPGQDFVDSVNEVLSSCSVVLVVIGARWLGVTDRTGQRRLDDDEDYVRMEIARALAGDALVVPVLIQGATMPQAVDLPDDLRRLARKNGLELSDGRWKYDVERLVEVIRHRHA